MRKMLWTGAGPRSLLLVAILGLMTLSGCLADDDPSPATEADANDETANLSPVTPDVQAPDGRDLRVELEAADEAPAPQWEVGDWFGVHVFFSPDDDGDHFNTVAARDDGDAMLMASDSEAVARIHGVVDIPLLGTIQKDTLAMTGLQGDWDFFDFPLTDGKSWDHQVFIPEDELTGGSYVPATFDVQYIEEIETLEGPRPGFLVTATADDGAILLEIDYIPAIRWFGTFTMYGLDGKENDDFELRAISMGFGKAWTGTYYIGTAENVVWEEGGVFVNPDDPTNSMADPRPAAIFEVSEDADWVIGMTYTWAFTGAQVATLVAPDGTHTDNIAAAPPLEFAFSGTFLEEPAVAGTWKYASPGVGVGAGNGVIIFQVFIETGTL